MLMALKSDQRARVATIGLPFSLLTINGFAITATEKHLLTLRIPKIKAK